MKAQRNLRVIEEAGTNLRHIHADIMRCLVGATLINSPGFVPLYGFLALVLVASYWFSLAKNALEERAVRTWAMIYTPAIG